MQGSLIFDDKFVTSPELEHQPLRKFVSILGVQTGINQAPAECISQLGFLVGIQFVLLLETLHLFGQLF